MLQIRRDRSVRDADVERSVSLAREDVDKEATGHSLRTISRNDAVKCGTASRQLLCWITGSSPVMTKALTHPPSTAPPPPSAARARQALSMCQRNAGRRASAPQSGWSSVRKLRESVKRSPAMMRPRAVRRIRHPAAARLQIQIRIAQEAPAHRRCRRPSRGCRLPPPARNSREKQDRDGKSHPERQTEIAADRERDIAEDEGLDRQHIHQHRGAIGNGVEEKAPDADQARKTDQRQGGPVARLLAPPEPECQGGRRSETRAFVMAFSGSAQKSGLPSRSR